ncbi:MAG: hypothetical protein HPY73_05655 [Methanomassiliicoccales archaeon]|nr:MAG: hypothetical protein HPY73_05655 [Methanomassiliicoccales archaeon]
MDFFEIVALILITLIGASIPVILNERSKRRWSQSDKMWDLKRKYSSELLLKMSEMELALIGMQLYFSQNNQMKKTYSIDQEFSQALMSWFVINNRLFGGNIKLECLKNGTPSKITEKDLDTLKIEIFWLSLFRFQMLTHEALIPITMIRGILIDDKITDHFYEFQKTIQHYINQDSHTPSNYEDVIKTLSSIVNEYNHSMKLELERTKDPGWNSIWRRQLDGIIKVG